LTKRDYYEVLGVERGASADAIKRAYRKRALEYHPDRNPGDDTAEERFKEATEAYEVLTDSEKRARYDQFGHAGVEAGGYGAPHFTDISEALRTFMRDFGFGGFDFFGGGAGETTGDRRRGSDLQLKLRLTLEEIAAGVKKTLSVKKQVRCATCDGTGAASGSSRMTCSTCGGRGVVRQVSRSLFGQFVRESACPQCDGLGEIVRDPCRDCQGEGRHRGEETITVQVPPGVTTGNYIPLRGQGDIGLRGGPAGDLMVVIEELEHDIFVRHGNDILLDLPVSYAQAALGDRVEVPVLDGHVRLQIPAGIQSGKMLRIRHRGLPALRGGARGDQLVRVRVWTPSKLSSTERELLEKLREVETAPPTAGGDREAPGWFERLRDVFSG
jgi:molecular chaperone DnaJ